MSRDLKRILEFVTIRIAWALLVAPWFLGALAYGLGRNSRELVATLTRFRYAFPQSLRCPNGHESSLYGMFECRGCGGLFAGWAFDRCPICGDSCGYVACEHCGLAVTNPFL